MQHIGIDYLKANGMEDILKEKMLFQIDTHEKVGNLLFIN